MTKSEAEQEALRRFHLLPAHDRQTYDQAEAYALRLAGEIDFPTFTDRQRLIAAWLIRDMARGSASWEGYYAAA